jgi:internalin A
LRELDLYDANVEDLAVLVELPGLRSLNIGRNRSLDQNTLAKMTYLEEIYLADNRVQDLSVLSDFAGLRTLWAPSEPVRKETGWLKNVPELNALALAVGGTDLSPLRHLTKLKTLYLNVLDGQDLSVVGELQQLDRLEIWGSDVDDVSALASLTELKSLRLHCTSVNDLGPVQHIADLMVTGASA